MSGSGTKSDPWRLKTPPQTSEYEMYLDERDGQQVIVCVVAKTTLLYDARAIDDLHAMLKKHGDWIELGSADEQKPANPADGVDVDRARMLRVHRESENEADRSGDYADEEHAARVPGAAKSNPLCRDRVEHVGGKARSRASCRWPRHMARERDAYDSYPPHDGAHRCP
jgi:hypothetical protein